MIGAVNRKLVVFVPAEALDRVRDAVFDAGAGRRSPSRGPGDVRLAIEAARAAQPGWAALSGRARGKYLFRLARLLQDRSREFAVLESIDGGKPIRESRDVDVPLAAAHLSTTPDGRTSWSTPSADGPAAGRGGADHPVELPAPDGGVEDRSGARLRQHRGAEARRDHPAHGPAAGRADRRGRVSAGRRQRRHGRRPHRRRPGRATRRGQGGLHGLHRRRQGHPPRARGHRDPPDAGARRQGRHIVFDDAAPDQAVEGIVHGIFFNQGHVCCAGSRLLVQEGVADDALGLWRRIELLRTGDPLDKNTDVGAINSRGSSSASRAWRGRGGGRGARTTSSSCPSAASGSPHPLDRGGATDQIAAEEIFGPVLPSSPSAPRPRASRRRTPLATGCRRVSGPTRARRHSRWRTRCRPGSSGRTPTTTSIRPLHSVATRRAASGARAG